MEVIVKRKKETTEVQRLNDGSKIRVVAYARVSTELERQQSSFESQKKYYFEKITSNPDWIFSGIYSDEGITGIKTENRIGFKNMIRDARNSKFDLILTKSISRFARNTVDTLKYIRFLKEKNIDVYFEEENINTTAMQGELLITILSSIAQQESENISAHILAGREMALKNGTKRASKSCIGYDYNKETGELIPNKDADTVRLIFELYDKYEVILKVVKELHDRGIKTLKGREYWDLNVIAQILENEKYIGNVVFGEHYISDTLSRKQVSNKGERKKYKYINHHEPIISKELFERVRAKYLKNKEIHKNDYYHKKGNHEVNLASWKGKCGFCGYSLAKKYPKNSDNIFYRCKKYHVITTRDLCPNAKQIKHSEVISSFLKGMKKLKNKINLNSLEDKVEEKLPYIRNIILNANFDKFNYELYDKLVKIMILGGIDETGKEDPFLLRFILKDDELFDNKNKNRRYFSNKTIELLNFDNKVNVKYRYHDINNNYEILNVESIKVKIEIEDNDSLIWKL